jgi:hypothetical protein
MGHLEMSVAFTAALNAQQWDTAANFLADEFTWSAAGVPASLGKQAYLAWQRAWCVAAPDYHLTWEPAREEGETVHGTVGVSGTQTNTLVLPGMPPIPATGKHFSATLATVGTWRGDQLIALTTEFTSAPTLLEQLGVQSPT